MELVKRYVYAVTNSLPEKQRSEIEKELTASIEDMAQDKANSKKPTQTHFRTVLEELGNPLVVAQQYRGEKEYLIGPAFYYYFIQTLKRILVLSLPIFSLVYALTYDYTLSFNVGNFIVHYGHGLTTVVLHVLFWVTGIFVLIEKAGVKIEQFNDTDGEWSVDSLPTVPEDPQISRVDTIANMLFYAGLIVGSVVLWRLIAQGDSGVTWLLNANLTSFWIPTLIALGTVAFILESVKLVKTRWNVWQLVATLGVHTAVLVYLVTLVLSQGLLSPSLDGRAYEIAQWSIGITVIICIFSYVSESYKVIKRYRNARLTK